MDLKLYINASLEMPLGKIIAQASHALGMAFMTHCRVAKESSDSVTLEVSDPTKYFLRESIGSIARSISINFVDDAGFEEIKHQSSDNITVVVDNGLTCFDGKKTETVILVDSSSGVVPFNERLAFDVDAGILSKQGFFVNRAKPRSDSELIAWGAAASLWVLVGEVSNNNSLTLDKSSPMYSWLTGAFGKTVVTSKKQAKYDEVKDGLVLESDYLVEVLDGSMIVTEPMENDVLSKFTYTKTFRLL